MWWEKSLERTHQLHDPTPAYMCNPKVAIAVDAHSVWDAALEGSLADVPAVRQIASGVDIVHPQSAAGGINVVERCSVG